MIYITGDTHNDIDASNVATKNIRYCCKAQGADYKDITNLIVLGDFGLPWYDCPVNENGIAPLNKIDAHLLKWYKEKPFTILAVMGNHDNYDMIQKLPEVEMFGSTVLKVSRNIFYLRRGEAYTIEGKSFLVLGGARSVDVAYRIPHRSWWEQETWTEDEKKSLFAMLEKQGTSFDYVLSHTGPSAGIICVDPSFASGEKQGKLQEDATVSLNDRVDQIVSYKKWFFGHWHSDWGYENLAQARHVPLYHRGVVV